MFEFFDQLNIHMNIKKNEQKILVISDVWCRSKYYEMFNLQLLQTKIVKHHWLRQSNIIERARHSWEQDDWGRNAQECKKIGRTKLSREQGTWESSREQGLPE